MGDQDLMVEFEENNLNGLSKCVSWEQNMLMDLGETKLKTMFTVPKTDLTLVGFGLWAPVVVCSVFPLLFWRIILMGPGKT